VLLGDSLTDWGEWHELLGFPAANRGISGDTTDDVLDRLDDVLARPPRTLALLIGVNDLIRGASVDRTVAGIEKIVARVREKAPQTQIIVQSLLPAATLYGDLNAKIDAVNARIGTSSTYAYLDVASALRGPDGTLDARFTTDGLHLSGEGYKAWAAVLAPALTRP
jgi:lysophospholipase L1-like esterase